MVLQTAILSTVGIILGILQSTLLVKIIPLSIVPDLALLMLIAAAWRYGSISGEISGFLIGLGFDVMSLAPLGFHAFLFTSVGYLFGRMKDNVAPGPFFLPVVGAVAATLIKYGGAFLLSLIFGLNSGAVRFFTVNAIWELLANMLLAPLVFLLVSFSGRLFEGRRGGFR
jgi:rod shape-determining protein MreD